MTILLIYLGVLSVCFLVGTLFFYKLNSETKIIYLLVLFSLVVEFLGFYNKNLSVEKKIIPIIHQIYSPMEAVLIGLYFYRIFEKSYLKKLVFSLTIVALIILGYDLYLNNSASLQNFKFYLLPMAFFAIFSILYLRQLLNSNLDLLNNPHFWIVTGILFFNTSFFFLSGFINYIRDRDLDLAKKLYSINHIINIFYYSLITYGFICQRNLMKSSS